jgi:hypothetical protein
MPRLFMSIQDISLAHAGTVLPPLADTKGESSVARDIERATSLFAHQHLDSQFQDTSSHSQLPTATHVRIETKSLSRMCERRCLCQCHIPLKAATPRWLRNLMGTTFVNFTGAPLLNHRSCDFRPCANTKHGKVPFASITFSLYGCCAPASRSWLRGVTLRAFLAPGASEFRGLSLMLTAIIACTGLLAKSLWQRYVERWTYRACAHMTTFCWILAYPIHEHY